MPADLPVAAPDPAAEIQAALEAAIALDNYGWNIEHGESPAALDALLAERQQDKERIEGLGGVIGIVLPYISTRFDRGRAAYALAWQAASEHAKRGLRAPAALAVEEDAE